jgi:hypothetical protein
MLIKRNRAAGKWPAASVLMPLKTPSSHFSTAQRATNSTQHASPAVVKAGGR